MNDYMSLGGDEDEGDEDPDADDGDNDDDVQEGDEETSN